MIVLIRCRVFNDAWRCIVELPRFVGAKGRLQSCAELLTFVSLSSQIVSSRPSMCAFQLFKLVELGCVDARHLRKQIPHSVKIRNFLRLYVLLLSFFNLLLHLFRVIICSRTKLRRCSICIEN